MTMATLVNYTHYRLIKLISGFLVNLVSACEEQSVLCEKSKRAAKMRFQGWRKGGLVTMTFNCCQVWVWVTELDF